MDIELDDDKEGGIAILKNTRDVKYAVIFTTAFNNYAQEAFEFSAVDYLIKTISPVMLANAIQRFQSRVQSESLKIKETFLNNLSQSNKALKSFAIPAPGGETICKQVSDIIYSEASASACTFHLSKKKKNKNVPRALSGQKTVLQAIIFSDAIALTSLTSTAF